jgi:hypothetical protein
MYRPDGTIVLVDFGIVGSDKSTGTTFFVLDSFGFTSPEVKNGKSGKPRSDVYSAGAVYLWLKTGKNASQIANEDCTGWDIPEDLEYRSKEIIRKAVTERTYRSARQMKEDLPVYGYNIMAVERKTKISPRVESTEKVRKKHIPRIEGSRARLDSKHSIVYRSSMGAGIKYYEIEGPRLVRELTVNYRDEESFEIQLMAGLRKVTVKNIGRDGTEILIAGGKTFIDRTLERIGGIKRIDSILSTFRIEIQIGVTTTILAIAGAVSGAIKYLSSWHELIIAGFVTLQFGLIASSVYSKLRKREDNDLISSDQNHLLSEGNPTKKLKE